MRIKDKKRFIIACAGLAVLLIIIIVVVLVGFNAKNTSAAAADEKQNALATNTQETSANTAVVNTENETSPVADPVASSNEAGEKVSEKVGEGITQVVNKNHSISADFKPDDLVSVDLPSTRDTQLREVAATALTGLFGAAETKGLELFCCSGYRSYETQAELYAWNVETYGVEGAELVSARPGMSEHQMGLAMDVTSASAGFDLLESFGSMPEGQFIKENAHKYGFIIRYPEGKTNITGYAYEPWHLRYVGVDVATDIYSSGKTMEEYYGVN
ncbi:M15 family metallopeptidase [Acetobacterium bakii]|uniref:D-alanyl-D-alanine carboxypeptidase-like core domain-containing protein n=1 Tax=Acetobacterium bakii TaxID=52689 RepID=A0A0L6U3M1_9FIRM|nr:M15 family metallopeptidase [Acetobacterium bakii]KNZ42365.1 hypothetical protein AKG39_06945 [Acetobacterium bakii]